MEASWRPSARQDAPSWSQTHANLANLAPRCAKLEQRWRQVGQHGAMMGPIWSTWKLRGPTWRTFGIILATFCWILGAILPKIAKTKKTTTVQRFGRFFGVLGLVLEAMLGYLGAMLGYLGAMLGHLGAMLAHLGANLAYVGRSWSHLGAILEQLGDKMGPRRGKIDPGTAKIHETL